ncbi:melanoma-associated antigen B5 [Cricetulus griseus]|uniref:Melanoma-associated antigen B3 n=2 Tax=Cricetulus griseus TaxID=10029 RepID=G3IEC7_CRIGR|nr:melanoma-associated antigen B5 [Cricetulus griseus]XP_027288485.1 melanoma-associated antigen B5 [Cricetulus griseus]EGV92272.1 Melanoma-associated antigen B3 [Cricetulus griseus]ERE63230.1 melanoma-associated antigen B3-like protein [Cricetulus griseus]
MPRGQKSKQNNRGRRRRARNDTQASESAQQTIEAAEESFPESGGAFEMPDEESVAIIIADVLSLIVSDESSIDDQDVEESLFRNYHAFTIHQDILAGKVAVLLQFLLDNYKMKQLTSMKDMMQVIGEQEINNFPEILRTTAERLEDIFAVELREVESSRPAYDLISKLKLPNNGRVRAGKGFPKTGFLMTVLGMIFMNGNCAREGDIWRMLRSMGVYPGKKHPIYGEPRKLITQDFVKLKYLEYQQVANSDPPLYEFQWGPKAYAETNKMTVLKFVAKINKVSPSSFRDLYEEALKTEQGKNPNNHKVSRDTPAKASAFSMMTGPWFPILPKFENGLFSRKKI